MVDKDARAGMGLAVKIAQKAEVLSSQPYLGRVGAIEGTREWPIPGLPYKLVYWIKGDTVEILRVIHQARDWP